MIEVAVVVGVGRADVAVVAPGHHEHRPLVGRNRDDRRDLVADERPGHRDVHALGGPDAVRTARFVERAHLVGPHPRGVDDRPGVDPDLLAVDEDDRAREAATSGMIEPDDAGPVQGHRTEVEGRRTCQGQGEAGIVGPGVVVEIGPGQAVDLQVRPAAEGLVAVEPLVALAHPQATREVVPPQRPAEGPGDPPGHQPVPGVDRDQERQHLDEVRCVPQQPLALGQRLIDESDLALLQVPQPSMHQLRRLRRGPGRKVVGLHERDGPPSRRCIERHPATRHPAAHDKEVEALGSQPLDRRRPLEGAPPPPAIHRLGLVEQPGENGRHTHPLRLRAPAPTDGSPLIPELRVPAHIPCRPTRGVGHWGGVCWGCEAAVTVFR